MKLRIYLEFSIPAVRRKKSDTEMKITQWNRLAEKLSAIYLACILSVFLLYFGAGGYAGIADSKWGLFLLLSGGYLLLLAAARLELAIVGTLPLPSPRALWKSFSPPRKTLCLLWLSSLLAAVLSAYRRTSLLGSSRHEGLLTITLYLGCCLMVSLYARLRPWMLWLFAASMSANCILALVQLAGYNPFSLYPQGMNCYDRYELYAGEFLGTVGNVDLPSAVLCIAIPLFWLALIKDTGRRKWLLCVPLALCLTVLCRASVAGGILAMAVGVPLTVPVLLKSRKARRTAAAAVLALGFLALLAVYLFGGRMGGTLHEAYELLHGRWNDSFGSGRLYIWRKVAPLIPQHPLFGCGPDTLGRYTDAAFERMNDTVGAVIRSEIDNAHNEYLNLLIERGAAAFILYLALLVQCARRWVRSASSHPVAALCGGAVLAYCIQAFFGLSLPASAIYFWLMLGGLISTETVQKTPCQAKKGERKNAKC